MTSTGIPEPLSDTVTELSGCSVISMRSARPASASSTELSTTSYTRWWSPRAPVEPMYMPGRSRTGSRPSRTVMSLAVYVALVMKKALQVKAFRATTSLSDRAVDSGSREAHPRSFFHCFAEFFRLDRLDPRARRSSLLRGGLGRGPARHLGGGRRAFGQRSRREAQARRRDLAEHVPEAPRDLPLELLELERPGGRGRRHVERAVPREPSRPRIG